MLFPDFWWWNPLKADESPMIVTGGDFDNVFKSLSEEHPELVGELERALSGQSSTIVARYDADGTVEVL